MMHPKEREYLDEESTLVVTVRSAAEFHDEVTTNLERLERGEPVETPHRARIMFSHQFRYQV